MIPYYLMLLKMEKQQLIIIQSLTIVLAISLTIVSYFGVFVENTYEREVSSMAAQGVGQDIVNLFFIVPVLIISLLTMQKNNRIGIFVFGGTVFYILYSFIIYCMGVNFNKLFLLYCLTLCLSIYLFIFYIYSFKGINIKSWFWNNIPLKLFGIYLLIISVVFYFLWLTEIVPALLNNIAPQSVSDYNLLVNPVHVVDMAFVLPGLIVTSILLMKRHSLGYFFTPIFLVFTVLLAIALTGMQVMMKIRGIVVETSVASVFFALATFSSLFLIAFLDRLKKGNSI